MIADHTWIHSLAEWLPFAALLVVGFGYLMGSWRRGLADTWKETVDAQQVELSTLKTQNERLSDEAASLKSALKKLEGVVEQLRTENAELRQLVMLERVPPALTETLSTMTRAVMEDVNTMHARQVQDLSAILDEKLHPIAQGIARILTGSPPPEKEEG